MSWFKTRIVVREFKSVTIIKVLGRLNQKACAELGEIVEGIVQRCKEAQKTPAIILYARWVRKIDPVAIFYLVSWRQKINAIADRNQSGPGRFVLAHLGRGMQSVITIEALMHGNVTIFRDLWSAQESFL